MLFVAAVSYLALDVFASKPCIAFGRFRIGKQLLDDSPVSLYLCLRELLLSEQVSDGRNNDNNKHD